MNMTIYTSPILLPLEIMAAILNFTAILENIYYIPLWRILIFNFHHCATTKFEIKELKHENCDFLIDGGHLEFGSHFEPLPSIFRLGTTRHSIYHTKNLQYAEFEKSNAKTTTSFLFCKIHRFFPCLCCRLGLLMLQSINPCESRHTDRRSGRS